MKALLTGAAGFVGNHLFHHLNRKGFEVIGVDNFIHPCKRPIQNITYMDIREKCILNLIKKVDIVYHLAALIHTEYSSMHPSEVFETNLLGTLNILEGCRRYDKKLIYTSTSEIYGSAVYVPMDEAHPFNPPHPYGVSKLAADKLCSTYRNLYGMKINIVRPFNIFGINQASDSYGGVISIFIRQAKGNEPITVFGSGMQSRDYTWYEDTLQMYDIATEQNFKEPINFGSGKGITILDLAKLIKKLCKSDSKILFLPKRDCEVNNLLADTSKAKELGFEITVPFEEGIKRLINEKEVRKYE